MKIWISPYSLIHKNFLNQPEDTLNGEGFLMKIQTTELAAGYADCRPWKIFGDRDVKYQVNCLKNRQLTPLLKRSLFFALIDGKAREEKRSLWDAKIRLRSHYTVTSLNDFESIDQLHTLWESGYRTIKVKAGRDPVGETAACLRLAKEVSFRWRLDFNGHGADPFLKSLDANFISQIDFIEDPEPYSEARWTELEKIYTVKFAIDQPTLKEKIVSKKRIRVIKPARQNLYARSLDVVTNSMDHPVGQSFAALQAQESVRRLGKQSTDYGLKTDHLFAKTPYFERLANSSPYFQPDINFGIGFDDLLEREPWIPL